MVFTTGYQANLGMISTLVGQGDFRDRCRQPRLDLRAGKQTQAEVIRFKHNEPSSLEARLRRLAG